MAIIYNEDKKVFNIKSKNTSYALMVADTGHLIHLYWGRKLESNKLDYIFKKYGKESTILDCCCGVGRHCRALAEKGYKVTGIDISKKQIEN